jgi:two-component system sensor histidine kinase YesM
MKQSIQTKIFISFLLVMILPTTVISISSYLISVHILKDKVSRSFADNLSYISNDINKNLTAMQELSDYLSINENVKSALSTSYDSDAQFYLDMKKVDQQFNDFFLYSSSFSYVSSVILIGKNERMMSYGNEANTTNTDELKKMPWFQEAMQLNGKTLWIGIDPNESSYRKNEHAISLARMIKNDAHDHFVGMAYIKFDSRIFTDIFQDLEPQIGREISIVDNHNKTVFNSNGNMKNQEISDLENIKNQKHPFTITMKNGRQYLTATHWIEKYDWGAIETIPMDELVVDNNIIIKFNSIVFLVSFLFSGIAWYFVSSSIVRPIKKLTETIRSVRANNILVKADIEKNDEIGLLNANFNYMMDRIHTLFSNVLEEKELKKDAEYKALQAQINPHFLSNTLNSIRWMAIIQKADNIKEVVEVLGRLLKNTIYISGQFTSIAEELQNLKDYLYIQKIRYKDKFEVIFHIDETILTHKCIKFFMQPLVENALFHGIEPREEGGIIWIKVEQQEDLVIFSVRDNGVGMSISQMESLLSDVESMPGKSSGIGLKNVNERIKRTYGNQYGLEIQSIVDQFTSVQTCFPKQLSDQL